MAHFELLFLLLSLFLLLCFLFNCWYHPPNEGLWSRVSLEPFLSLSTPTKQSAVPDGSASGVFSFRRSLTLPQSFLTSSKQSFSLGFRVRPSLSAPRSFCTVSQAPICLKTFTYSPLLLRTSLYNFLFPLDSSLLPVYSLDPLPNVALADTSQHLWELCWSLLL